MERYFDHCVQSLLNQTSKDIEIILVDDGSSDNCLAMCDEYQSHYPDIVKVIHQDNYGQNAAWNAGLDAAVGQWICFVDSDDWVEPNMVETMLSYAEKDDADLHIFSFSMDYVNGSVLQSLPEMTLSEKAKQNYRHQNEINMNSYTAAWGKLYRRSYLEENQLRFYPRYFHSEDSIFMRYIMQIKCNYTQSVYIIIAWLHPALSINGIPRKLSVYNSFKNGMESS